MTRMNDGATLSSYLANAVRSERSPPVTDGEIIGADEVVNGVGGRRRDGRRR
jgi:hypothetical protein